MEFRNLDCALCMKHVLHVPGENLESRQPKKHEMNGCEFNYRFFSLDVLV